MSRLKDKVCIITGGASGIGRATALLFASEGGTVVVVDVDEKGAEETVHKIREKGGEATYVKCDVSEEADVARMVDDVISRYGRIDVLFCNVGVAVENDSIFELTRDKWDRVLAVNLTSVFLCTKMVVPYMVKRRSGSIVNNASIIGIVGEPGSKQLSYAASKGGIMGFSKQLANDLALFNIRVNCVCPGYTDTPALRRAFDTGVNPADSRRERESLHLLNRFADPEEIAKAVLFLASDESSFMTGALLVVDGGFTAR